MLCEDEVLMNEISRVILTHIGEYLRTHPSEIKETLGIGVSYHYQPIAEQLANKKLMNVFIKHVSTDIAFQGILNRTDLTKIVESVIASSALQGLRYGRNDYWYSK